MDVATYRQMIGRAGRVGLHSVGDSVLMLKKDQQRFARLMTDPLPMLQSKLDEVRAMQRVVLEAVVSEAARDEDEVARFVSLSLLAQQRTHPKEVREEAMDALKFLLDNEFVYCCCNSNLLRATQFGKATFFSGMTPIQAWQVCGDLKRARKNLFLESDLHLCFLLPDGGSGALEIDR